MSFVCSVPARTCRKGPIKAVQPPNRSLCHTARRATTCPASQVPPASTRRGARSVARPSEITTQHGAALNRWRACRDGLVTWSGCPASGRGACDRRNTRGKEDPTGPTHRSVGRANTAAAAGGTTNHRRLAATRPRGWPWQLLSVYAHTPYTRAVGHRPPPDVAPTGRLTPCHGWWGAPPPAQPRDCRGRTDTRVGPLPRTSRRWVCALGGPTRSARTPWSTPPGAA